MIIRVIVEACEVLCFDSISEPCCVKTERLRFKLCMGEFGSPECNFQVDTEHLCEERFFAEVEC